LVVYLRGAHQNSNTCKHKVYTGNRSVCVFFLRIPSVSQNFSPLRGATSEQHGGKHVKTLQIKSKYYVFVAKCVEKIKISRRFAAPAPQEADNRSENT